MVVRRLLVEDCGNSHLELCQGEWAGWSQGEKRKLRALAHREERVGNGMLGWGNGTCESMVE